MIPLKVFKYILKYYNRLCYYINTYLIGHYILQLGLRNGVIYIDFKRQTFLKNFFMAGLFTLKVFASNLLRSSRFIWTFVLGFKNYCYYRQNLYSSKKNERKPPKKFLFSYFVLMPDLGYDPGLYV